MLLYSCKALYFAVLTTFAYVGIFVYWQGYTQQQLARHSHHYFHEWQKNYSTASTSTSSTSNTTTTNEYNHHVRKSGSGEGAAQAEEIPKSQAQVPPTASVSGNNNVNNSNNNILNWNDEDTKLDMIYDAMKTYCRKSMKEIDIVHGLGIGAVLEMVDPMGGRNFNCLAQYFYNWTYTNSSSTTKDGKDDLPRFPVFESFFEWLDFGAGKDLQLIDDDGKGNQTIDCPRSPFDLKRHRKFTATELARHEIEMVNADIVLETTTTNGNGNATTISNPHRIPAVKVAFAQSQVPLYNGEWLVVWGPDRKIYVLDEKWGNDGDDHVDHDNLEVLKIHYGHATFFCGRPVLYAGLIFVVNGTISWISMSSGHYKPTLPYMRTFYEFLRDEKGINVTRMEWREHSNESLDANWVETVGKNASYGTYASDY